jgi:hypothetical protein
MYLVLKNVRLNHVTYEKGSLVDAIPDQKYAHCFKKDDKKEVKRGNKAETASLDPETEKR